MKYEAENGVEKLTDARWRTAQAVGTSESTITRILREERQASTSKDKTPETNFKSPSRPKRGRTKCKLDDFDMGVLRRTITTFHTEFNEVPTLRKVKQVLIERIGYSGCLETLRTILKESGYEWLKMDDNSKVLVEKHDVQMLRFQYLTQLKKYRDEGRYIVFTGETYVHTTNTQNVWRKLEKGVLPLQKNTSKGIGITIVHAGGCQGFVPNAGLVSKANATSVDYHDNMNLEDYKNWLTTKLLPNLPKYAVIVADSASYNALSEKAPNFNSNKNAMQTWLAAKHVPFNDTMKKIELYDLILKNKDRLKSFVIDELIRSKGFETLRIPAHHPELNPIKTIWEILKNYLANKDLAKDFILIMSLINERLEKIDSTMWSNTCRHVEEIEKQYLQYFDMDLNEFNINYESDESDSFEMSE
uniref:Tc1-like transposase DDE domain-containing protein n=1 Tax=Heliothis virescens TaxID=7102 RepID=A0A2A4K0Z7_HELVI